MITTGMLYRTVNGITGGNNVKVMNTPGIFKRFLTVSVPVNHRGQLFVVIKHGAGNNY
jgi:hypothetical protein